MRTSREFRDQLPDRCKRCPVINHADRVRGNAEWSGSKQTKLATKYLDESEGEEGLTKGVLSQIGAGEGRRSLQSADLEMNAERWALVFIGAGFEDCPGSVRGTPEPNRIFSSLDFITGERTCMNPAFAQFTGNSALRTMLHVGNWIGTHTDMDTNVAEDE